MFDGVGSQSATPLEESRQKSYLKLGIILSTVYVFSFVSLMLLLYFQSILKIDIMELNQIGDFLAGVFAPLAFLWIVVGYLQQSEELRLQVKELNASVNQQSQLVNAAREQIDLEKFAREKELIITTSADLPYFEPNLSQYIYDQYPDGYHTLFQFVNLGQLACEVSIYLKTGVGKILGDTHQNVSQGQVIQFYLHTSEELIANGWHHVVTITSLSAMKRPRVQEFSLTREQTPIFQACHPPYKQQP
jgi:hypothetical protein